MIKIGIYRLDFDNKKYYIGSSINIDLRYKHHCNALKNNKHDNIIMQNYYNKYQKLPTIQIIQYTPNINKDELLLIEQKWLNFHIGLENNINITKKAGSGPGNKPIYEIGQKCANPNCNITYINRQETHFSKGLCNNCYIKKNQSKIDKKKYDIKYYQDNKDKLKQSKLEYNKKYRELNKDKLRQYKLEYDKKYIKK